VDKSDLMVGYLDIISQVWLLVYGFPHWARKEKAVEEVSYLVGDFIEVDTKSLPGLDPIRVKVSCKDPSSIQGSSKVYFNGRGFLLVGILRMRRMRGRHFLWTSLERRRMMRNHGRKMRMRNLITIVLLMFPNQIVTVLMINLNQANKERKELASNR